MQRYDIEPDYMGGRMIKDNNGDYVLFEDAAKSSAIEKEKTAQLALALLEVLKVERAIGGEASEELAEIRKIIIQAGRTEATAWATSHRG